MLTTKRIKLKGLMNTRDLGGIKTLDGKTIKSGMLFRSSRLYKLPKSTRKVLEKFNISTIIDLRVYDEIKKRPDTSLKNAEYVHLPLVCTATPEIPHNGSMFKTWRIESKRIKHEFKTTDEYMKATYKNILFNKESHDTLKKFFEILKSKDVILWHCTGGKDRTGICSMLLQGVLGVSEDVIINDYVASNTFQKKKRILSRIGLYIALTRRNFRGILLKMLTAKREYIECIIDYLKASYGGILEFCQKELALTDEDVSFLKTKYLA